MNIVIAGGTGFLGQFLAKAFINEGYHVTVLSRSRAKVRQVFGDRVNVLDWNALRQLGPGTLINTDLLINLCGSGIADERWSKERKQELIDSRIIPANTLAKVCVELGENAPVFICASGAGIYGTQTPVMNALPLAFDETTILPNKARDFAQELTQRWEMAIRFAENAAVRVIKMRLGVVLGHGGALKKLLPTFKLGLGGKLGSGNQPFPWICIIDVLRAILFCYENAAIKGPVNFIAPEAVTQAQFAKMMGEILKRPTFIKTPEFVLSALYGEMAENLLLAGQHVTPKVLTENGFEFQYPRLKEALRYALSC